MKILLETLQPLEHPAHNILCDLNPRQVLSAAHTAHSDTFGTHYFSRTKAQCPLVISSLKREEPTSHGQISLCKCKRGQKVLEEKFCRAPLNLMHPDCYQVTTQGFFFPHHWLCQKWIREDSQSPFFQISFWSNKLSVVRKILNKVGFGQRHLICLSSLVQTCLVSDHNMLSQNGEKAFPGFNRE